MLWPGVILEQSVDVPFHLLVQVVRGLNHLSPFSTQSSHVQSSSQAQLARRVWYPDPGVSRELSAEFDRLEPH